MSLNVINEETDENIKNYLSEGAVNDKKHSDEFGFNENNKKGILKTKKFIYLFIIFIIFSFSIILFYFTRESGKQSFQREMVSISISALGDKIESGEELVFDLEYKNETNVDLKNVKVNFYVPVEFLFVSSDEAVQKEETVLTWNLKNIPAGESGNIKLFGKIAGELNEEYDFSSCIFYTPDNFNYEFQAESEFQKIEIIAVPFELSIYSSESINDGSEIEYIVDYKNISDRDFKFINIEVQLPEDFKYEESQPEPLEKNNNFLNWEFQEVSSDKGGKISIKGNLFANGSKEKEIKVSLSVFENDMKIQYIRKSAITEITEIPITIKQTVNGEKDYITSKGEYLEYKIQLKNISDKTIKGLVVTSKVLGEIDIDTFDIINGYYDKKSNKITWSAFNIPQLASFISGAEKEISFRVKVKDYLEIKKVDSKNFIITNLVSVNSFNFDSSLVDVKEIIVSNQNVVKLKAFLFIQAKGYFNDDGRIKNVGFIPPEVGKETNYSIHLNLSNLFNDLSQVKIVSVLPDNVNWTGNYIKVDGKVSLGGQLNGVFIPEIILSEDEVLDNDIFPVDNEQENYEEETMIQIKEERIFYNPETREVVWEIPELDANTGIISPVKEVVFQISINPKHSDIGKVVKIINGIKAVGYDSFANKQITFSGSEITTELPDDYSIGEKEGIVIFKSNQAE